MNERVIVGFDGECLMCDGGIRFLASHDRHDRIRFLKLQSDAGRKLEQQAGQSRLTTMVVEADGRIYTRSAAVLRCAQAMGGIWAFLGALARLIPGKDLLYDWIAGNRHRWFPGNVCSLPSPALRERLLDGDGV